MKNQYRHLARRALATCLALVVASQLSYGAPAPANSKAQQPQATQIAANQGAPLPEAPQPQAPQTPQPQPQTPQPQAAQSDQQDAGQKPVGTAAAPVTRPAGVAGTRPSGAAIAPAKQRRVRRILIRVGIIVGAAAAVGTVAALSRGSSSRP